MALLYVYNAKEAQALFRSILGDPGLRREASQQVGQKNRSKVTGLGDGQHGVTGPVAGVSKHMWTLE